MTETAPLGGGGGDMRAEVVPGSQVGAYRIVEVLGRGGTATVYLARDASDREVALKLYRGRQALKDPARFWREVEIVRALSHPGLVGILDFGWTPWPHLVMERVHGVLMRVWLKQSPPLADASRVLSEICEAVAYLHAHQVVHRDLKPENVFVRDDGRAAVADFGTAQGLDMARLTTTGKIQGTPGYVAPEQLRGERASPASDQYALGVLIFETLTGQSPFADESPLATMYRQLNDEIPSACKLRPELSEAVDACLLRMLAAGAAGRFATVADAATALRAAL